MRGDGKRNALNGKERGGGCEGTDDDIRLD